MARRAQFAHIEPMASRPCRPSDDVKRLWQQLLPGTPFPACADEENANAAQSEDQHAAVETSGGEVNRQIERARGR